MLGFLLVVVMTHFDFNFVIEDDDDDDDDDDEFMAATSGIWEDLDPRRRLLDLVGLRLLMFDLDDDELDFIEIVIKWYTSSMV